jgi:hypothetical protein
VHAIVRLGIAENVPPQGISVHDLAMKLNISASLTRRLLAHGATHHIYYEASPDVFVHTAASRVLAENEGMRKWILIGAEELIPATLKVRLHPVFPWRTAIVANFVYKDRRGIGQFLQQRGARTQRRWNLWMRR